MDDTKTTTPSPAAAASATSAAACDAARDKPINADIVATSDKTTANSNNNSVKLLIKSSNQQYDDLNVESDLCWTVRRLKRHLSLVYPGKPDVNDQKLIYSGKLLDDTQKISEVIRSYKDVYQQHHIFHLVCATRNIIKPLAKMSAPPKDTTTTSATAGAATTTTTTTTNNTNELRQRNVIGSEQLQQQQQQQQQSQQQSAPAWTDFWQRDMLASGSQDHQRLAAARFAFQQQQALLYNAWMQQVYAQYMQQWMQRDGTSDNSPLPPLPFGLMPTTLPVIPGTNVATVEPTTLQAQQQQQPQQPNEAAAAAPAAGQPRAGGNFRNIQEEPEVRDWLDNFFAFSRLALFITVLYFNSSPLRCLLVILIAGVIYLYHIGVLRRRRERNNNNINRNNNAADEAAFAAVQQIQRMMDAVERENNNPQEANVPAAGAEAEGGAGAGGAAAPAGDAATGDNNNVGAAAAVAAEAVAVVEPPNANNSVISVVRTFVVTFFTSLLPEAPAL